MSEDNEESQDMQLVHTDPFHSPTESLDNEDGMRRLFLVHYSCPLCGEQHSCELCMTLVAKDEDEMMERALKTLGRDEVKVNSLAPFMKEYHQAEGDYLQRAKAYAREGVRYPFQITRVVMTDEESYTCEYCQMKFETIGRLAPTRREKPQGRGQASWRGRDGPVPKAANNVNGQIRSQTRPREQTLQDPRLFSKQAF